jgi:hypothetical protein
VCCWWTWWSPAAVLSEQQSEHSDNAEQSLLYSESENSVLNDNTEKIIMRRRRLGLAVRDFEQAGMSNYGCYRIYFYWNGATGQQEHTNYISDFYNYSSIKICGRYINYDQLLGRTIYKNCEYSTMNFTDLEPSDSEYNLHCI